MRSIDLSHIKKYQGTPLAKVWTIYNDRAEAFRYGISGENILHNWREVENNIPAIVKAKNGELYLVSNDTFVPDYWNHIKKEVIWLRDSNGEKIPTTGCVVPVVEYLVPSGKANSRAFIRIPTGTFSLTNKILTTEKRKRLFSLSRNPNRFLGHPNRISTKKRRATLHLLNPLSPTYGKMVSSFLAEYPHYKRHKSFVLRKIVLVYYNQPWFYRLIKTDWVCSMLTNDLKMEIEKTVNAKYLADRLALAMTLAEHGNKPKEILDVVREYRSILEKETNPRVSYPSTLDGPTEQGRLPRGVQPILEAHIDDGAIDPNDTDQGVVDGLVKSMHVDESILVNVDLTEFAAPQPGQEDDEEEETKLSEEE